MTLTPEERRRSEAAGKRVWMLMVRNDLLREKAALEERIRVLREQEEAVERLLAKPKPTGE